MKDGIIVCTITLLALLVCPIHALGDQEAAASSLRTLSIMEDMFFDEERADAFSRKYPDISVEQVDVYEDELPSLIARNDAPDLFVLSGYQDTSELIEKHSVDLSGDEELMKHVDQFYPQLREYVVRGGKLVGYPSYIYGGLWIYDTGAFESLRLKQPETMEELLDLLVLWDAEYADTHSDKTMMHFGLNPKGELFHMALNQYMELFEKDDAPVSFDTPEFHALIDLFETSPLEYIFYDDEQEEHSHDENHADPLIENGIYFGYLSPSYSLDYQPRLLENTPPIATTDIDWYIVNPNSKNNDMALAYIRFMAEEGQADRRYMMKSSLNDPLENKYYSGSSSNEPVALPEEFDPQVADVEWEIHSEHIEQYRTIAPEIRMWRSHLLYESSVGQEIFHLIERYQMGEIAIAQLVEKLDNMAKVAFEEKK